MRTTAARAVEWTAALLLAAFGAAKFAAPPPSDRPGWYRAALLVTAAVEIAIAVWLASGRGGRRPVLALAALGASVVLVSFLVPASVFGGGGCGCLGWVRLANGHRVLAGGALVLLAGLRLALAPPDGTRDAPPAE